MLQTSLNSLKCKYGFSRSKLWKEGKSWIMLGLKLKWDASGGKTIYDGALVLVGFMWPLSVLTRLFFLWSDWLSSSIMFSDEDEDFLESLPLNVHNQTLMQVQKKKEEKEKEKEEEETKIRKTIKVKRKIKYIIYTVTYLPGNGAKNLTRSKSWCLIPSAGVSK